MDTNRFAEDISYYKVVIRSYDGRETDVSDLVHSLQVYESVFLPTMSVKLLLNDRAQFINLFPLSGEEMVRVTFTSISNAQKTELVFFLYRCDSIMIDPSFNNLSYALFGISQEGLIDMQAPVTKSYNGQISNAVADIYTTYLKTTKPVTIEATAGNVTLIIPKLSPFEALEFLKRRAISGVSSASVFMSFETAKGFSFKTLETLIKEGTTQAAQDRTYQYVYEHAILQDQTRTLLSHSVIDFSQVKKYDTLEQSFTGYFHSEAIKFDMAEKSASTVNFNLSDKYPNWTVLAGTGGSNPNSIPHTNKFVQDFESTGFRKFAVIFDKYRDEVSIADNVGENAAYFSGLLQNEFEILITGNNRIVAGDVIKIDVPALAATSTTASDGKDKYLSGRFFVAEVTHNVISKTKFYTKLSCFKDSYSEAS